jgi:hypothetical protein
MEWLLIYLKVLSNAQRVNANLGTLALTGTYVFGATLAAIAIFASNPVGWGLAAAGALVIGVALLVKATRALLNTIEAIKEQESGLTTDSRFKLTKNEVANLKKLGYSSKDISAIKDVIRGLAVRASTMSETAFIGSNDDYSNLIEELTKIKQGTISEDIKEIYCIKGPGKSAPSIDETQAGEEASPVI